MGGLVLLGGVSTPLHAMEYLCKSMVCNRKEQTNFYKLDCLIGKCENNCQVTDIQNDLEAKVKLESNINCYVFDNDETNHYDKKGQPKKYSTTARVDEKDTLENIVLHLQSVATKYLILRFFFLVNDKIYWAKLLQRTEYYTLWINYSQNIALAEQKQVQYLQLF